jgi:hypothetical protein
MQTLQASAVESSNFFSAQEVLALLRSVAASGAKTIPSFLDVMQQRAAEACLDLEPSDISGLLRALAEMGVVPSASLVKAIEGRVERFGAGACASLVEQLVAMQAAGDAVVPLETPPRARGGVDQPAAVERAPICSSSGGRSAGARHGGSLSTTTPDTCPRDADTSPRSSSPPPPAPRSSEPGLAGSIPGDTGPRLEALGLGGIPSGAKQGEMQGDAPRARVETHLAEIVWRAPAPLVLNKYQRPIALLVRTPPPSDLAGVVISLL